MSSLVADYETTSSSSNTEGEDMDSEYTEETISKKSSQSSPTLLLPSANSILRGCSKTAGDVFNNRFLESEKLEIDKLQKHVKMVDSENHLLQKNGRKICWNNRKGRCRFGNKCKYAHDSDLVDPKGAINQQIINKELETPTATNLSSDLEVQKMRADKRNYYNNKVKTRKRIGLGDSIIPGKRAMKIYHDSKKFTL